MNCPRRVGAFSSLPPEIKLKIFQFLDHSTIRRVLPAVNSEFRRLSSDFSVNQRYEVAEYDECGLIAKLELSHELFKEHLRTIIMKPQQSMIVKYLQCSKSTKIVIIGKETDRWQAVESPLLTSRKSHA